MAIRYSDEFDDNGILKDGRTMRVSMQMRDTAMTERQRQQRITDTLSDVNSRPLLVTDGRTDDRMALHRPGFRVPVMDGRRAVVRDAYETYERELCSGWQTDAEVEVERAQHHDNDGNGRTKVEQAYRTYDAELANAWRNG